MDAVAELEKLKRRQARNQRAAFAKGLLLGIQSMLKPGDVVFDCGANVGEVSEVLAQSGATVHAFEPDPYAFEKLTKRFRKTPNVILHNVAVGVHEGTIKLMRASNFEENPRGASVKSTVISGGRKIDETGENVVDVQLIDLPTLIETTAKEHGEIAFLKMDIEGAELELLEEMDKRDLFDNVRLTVAETHENKFKELRGRFAALRENVSKKYPLTRVNLDWI